MSRKVLLIYGLAIHCLLLIVLIKSNFFELLKQKLRLNSVPASRQIQKDPFYDRMVANHARMDTSVPSESVVFIGDSITQSLCVDAVTVPAVNFGIDSDTTEGVLRRLPTYLCLNRARSVVLAVGINDLKAEIEMDQIVERFRSIMQSIPLKPRLLLSATLPVDRRFVAFQSPLLEQKRRLLNQKLNELSKNRPNTYFVDSSPKLLDKTGSLSPRFHIGDGIHLNESGYDIWIGDLREALK